MGLERLFKVINNVLTADASYDDRIVFGDYVFSPAVPKARQREREQNIAV